MSKFCKHCGGEKYIHHSDVSHSCFYTKGGKATSYEEKTMSERTENLTGPEAMTAVMRGKCVVDVDNIYDPIKRDRDRWAFWHHNAWEVSNEGLRPGFFERTFRVIPDPGNAALRWDQMINDLFDTPEVALANLPRSVAECWKNILITFKAEIKRELKDDE